MQNIHDNPPWPDHPAPSRHHLYIIRHFFKATQMTISAEKWRKT